MDRERSRNSFGALTLTEFMFARVVRDLEDVEGDAVDAGLAQSVQAGDVRASENIRSI